GGPLGEQPLLEEGSAHQGGAVRLVLSQGPLVEITTAHRGAREGEDPTEGADGMTANGMAECPGLRDHGCSLYGAALGRVQSRGAGACFLVLEGRASGLTHDGHRVPCGGAAQRGERLRRRALARR